MSVIMLCFHDIADVTKTQQPVLYTGDSDGSQTNELHWSDLEDEYMAYVSIFDHQGMV